MPKSASFTMPSLDAQEVARLDVAVHDAAAVRVVEPAARLRDDAERLGRPAAARARAGSRRTDCPSTCSMTMYWRPLASSRPKSKTCTMFGCTSRAAASASRRKRETNCCVVGEMLGEQLHRDVALEPAVEREHDGRHAAAAQALAQLVAVLRAAGRSRRRPRARRLGCDAAVGRRPGPVCVVGVGRRRRRGSWWSSSARSSSWSSWAARSCSSCPCSSVVGVVGVSGTAAHCVGTVFASWSSPCLMRAARRSSSARGQVRVDALRATRARSAPGGTHRARVASATCWSVLSSDRAWSAGTAGRRFRSRSRRAPPRRARGP